MLAHVGFVDVTWRSMTNNAYGSSNAVARRRVPSYAPCRFHLGSRFCLSQYTRTNEFAVGVFSGP